MYEDEANALKSFTARLAELRKCLDVEATRADIAVIESELTAPNFWDDVEGAQKVMQRLKSLKGIIAAPDELESEIDDATVLVGLAQSENDGSMGAELTGLVNALGEKLDRLEITSLFTDPRDSKSAIINIHPGAGGTESCDWAQMLYRMITRCCERHEFPVEVVDYQEGDEAGLKSATIIVDAPFAYGNLKSEAGVHRLVRISPFDAAKRRHTSFAAIEVIPQVDDDVDIEVKEEDVVMQVFRSSGPGGQKVNKTSSAVRLTHTPTGIVVACQIERSQHRNRATAMQMLKAKLYDIEMQKKEVERLATREGQQDVAWGSQIRSYVLHPYQLVKDHRTDTETGNVDRVLDGDLDLFVSAYLKWNLQRKGRN
ncbi:MAG TPA: peptide chain release factor 2 [Candidatus Hydrogenedentes bacterium]|nr:peptide chain release factor 2 [Candidatus Hydrogenedentota bacterium]